MSVPATLVLEGLDALGVNLLGSPNTQYAIVTTGSSVPVVTPDTIMRLNYRGEQRISDYPVEQGAFSSYNKVAQPFDLRMTLVCGGRNYYQDATQKLDQYLNGLLGTSFGQPMSRADFLQAMEDMLASTALFDVVTPDFTYEKLNLVHFDYSKTSTDGAVQIIADCGFREVRETVTATFTNSGQINITSDSPSAATPVNAGRVTGMIPTVSQSSITTAAAFV